MPLPHCHTEGAGVAWNLFEYMLLEPFQVAWNLLRSLALENKLVRHLIAGTRQRIECGRPDLLPARAETPARATCAQFSPLGAAHLMKNN